MLYILIWPRAGCCQQLIFSLCLESHLGQMEAYRILLFLAISAECIIEIGSYPSSINCINARGTANAWKLSGGNHTVVTREIVSLKVLALGALLHLDFSCLGLPHSRASSLLSAASGRKLGCLTCKTAVPGRPTAWIKHVHLQFSRGCENTAKNFSSCLYPRGKLTVK